MKHHCRLSSKSKSNKPDAHIVDAGQENCRCQCHDEEIGDTNGNHTDWQENEDGKYKKTDKENLRLPEQLVHAFHFFPGVKPMFEPPAASWEECQEACRNLKTCHSWSMYSEEHRIYGNTCRIYDVKLGDPEKCDFTIPNFWRKGNFPCVAKKTDYGFQNIGQNVSFGGVQREVKKSAKNCKALGWSTTNWGDEFKHTELVCGARPDCSQKAKSYGEARQICKKQGARLCTLAETQANEAARTGCNMDKMATWTSTPCKKGGEHYYIQLANERFRKDATRDLDKRVHCTHQEQQTSSGNNDVGQFVKRDGYMWNPTRIGGFLEIAVQCCADQDICGNGDHNHQHPEGWKGHLCTATKEAAKRSSGAWVYDRNE